jgi:hypothetical protein
MPFPLMKYLYFFSMATNFFTYIYIYIYIYIYTHIFAYIYKKPHAWKQNSEWTQVNLNVTFLRISHIETIIFSIQGPMS